MQYQVVGLGQCSIDYLGIIDRYPAVDQKKEITEFTIQGGGPTATALVALKRWGIAVSFIGKVSDDNFGNFIKEGLVKEGIGIENLIVEENKTSQFAFISVEKGTGKRNIFWTRGTMSPLKVEELDEELIKGSSILHLDGLMMEASIQAAQWAKEAGVTVILDAGSLRPGMVELAKMTDYLVTANKFAKQYIGDDDPEKAVKEMFKLGPKAVVTTLGNRGCVTVSEKGFFYQPAIRVPTVDTTGAGDIFHAGFTYGILQNWSIRKVVRFAAVAAALKCRKLGGRTGIPALEEINDFM